MHVCVGWWILCSSRCSLFYIFLGVKISVFFFFYDYLRWPFNLLFCFYLRNQVVEMFNIREELKRSPSQEGWTGSWEKIWRRTCWWNSCGSLEWVGWKQRQWPSGTRSARSSSAGKWRGRNREWSFSAAHRTSPARSCFASRKTGPESLRPPSCRSICKRWDRSWARRRGRPSSWGPSRRCWFYRRGTQSQWWAPGECSRKTAWSGLSR